MVRIPSHRQPTHPGEMLRAEFLEPFEISQRELADAIRVPYQRVNELVNQKRGITPSTALRLARFNVNDKAEAEKAKNGDAVGESGSFFTGIPSPAGALLVLLPMTLSFAFHNRPILPDWMICLHMVLIGFLMISSIPTWSFKTTKVSRRHVKFLLVGVAIFAAALATYAWTTLVVLCFAYVGMVIWGLLKGRKPIKSKGN